MGYESKFYIVEKGHYDDSRQMHYGHVIAMFDMSKCYPLSSVFQGFKKTDCFFYADDGNTEIVEDMYGEPLKEATIERTLRLVQTVMEEEDYRRLLSFEALLRALQAQQKDGKWGDLAVLHYGY